MATYLTRQNSLWMVEIACFRLNHFLKSNAKNCLFIACSIFIPLCMADDDGGRTKVWIAIKKGKMESAI